MFILMQHNVQKNLLVMLIDLVCPSPTFLKLGLFYCLSEPSSPSPVKPVKRYKLLFITIILDLQDEDLDVLKCLRLWMHTRYSKM